VTEVISTNQEIMKALATPVGLSRPIAYATDNG